jgi:hypothetical protein
MRYTLLSAFALLASAAAAQQPAVDLSLGQAAAPSADALAAPAQGGWLGIHSDDFNRPDGPIGPQWTDQVGTFSVFNMEGTAASGLSWTKHNAAATTFAQATMTIDFLGSVSGGSNYVAAMFGDGTSSGGITIKVQNQTGLYGHVGMYRGHNGGGWGGTGSGFFTRALPSAQGRMHVYFQNGGDDVVLDIDNDFDGIIDEQFIAQGILSAGGINITPDAGIGAWNDPRFDDWTLDDGSGPPITVYCTAKTNSLGCTPSISASGNPSASMSSGFSVDVAMVRNGKSGLFFYKAGGTQANLTFQCGTLCVGPSGIKRTPAQSAGGNPPPANDCSGVYSLDMNAFAAGAAGGNPDPALLVPGTLVQCQTWGRDQGFAAPCNTTLSDGLEYTVGS